MTQPYDPAQSGGPFLQVACLCENVVQRADGVLTLVNIVDRLNIVIQGLDAPATMPPQNYQIYLVIILKAGRARGRYDLTFEIELPDVTRKKPAVLSLNFEGEEDRGIQIVQRLSLTITQEGLHWIHISLADRLLTKVPLRVVYSRISTGPAAQRQAS